MKGKRRWNAILPVALAAGLAFAACGGKPAVRGTPGAEGVSFLVTPSDAEVLVDNVLRGKAADFPDDHPLKLPVGPHVLELRAPSFESYVRQLAVSWQAKRVEATLPRKEEAPAQPKESTPATKPPS